MSEFIRTARGGEIIFSETLDLDGEEVVAEVHAAGEQDERGYAHFNIERVYVDGKDARHCLDIHQIHDLETEAAYWCAREERDAYRTHHEPYHYD